MGWWTPEVLSAAERFLQIEIRSADRLDGGHVAGVLRVDTDIGTLVLHANPATWTRGATEWVHSVAMHAHRSVPEVVAPIDRDGRTAFEWSGRQVAAFPYVAGEFLDREDPALRADAARLLAAIHHGLLDFPGGERPPSPRVSTPPDPEEISDPALDSWWTSINARGMTTGPTHGDYYRMNLLCADHHIVGIIDWHDATVRPIALELAQATFELCHDWDQHFQPDRADDFLAAYCAAGGPVPRHELELLPGLIRVWLRDNIRKGMRHNATLTDYHALQVRAFRELADSRWEPPG